MYWLTADVGEIGFGGAAAARAPWKAETEATTRIARESRTADNVANVVRRPSDAGAAVMAAAAIGVVAAAVFLLALENGGYDLRTRAGAAILAWWALLLVAVTARPPRAVLLRVAPVVAPLVAYALWTSMSAAWATDAEAVVAELNYPLLYLAIFLLAATVACIAGAVRVCDGLAVGAAGVGLLALGTRLDPGFVSLGGAETILPSVQIRLSYPIGYWNGLGVLLAMAVPLLIRVAIDARSAVARGAALAPVPALAVAMYLTSSRGAVAAAVVGAVVFAAAAARHWAAVSALAVSGVAAFVAIRFVAARDELVNGPLGTPLAAEQGHDAAAVVAAICVAAAVAWAVGTAVGYGRIRVPRQVSGLALGLVVVVTAAALLAGDPLARFRDFREPPAAAALDPNDFVRSHFASSNGSGRWQLWERAAAAFRDEPLHGLGAGSFEAWWARTGTLPVFVRDAHSLYLENLAELGIVGFLLIGATLVALVGGAATWRRRAETAADAGAATAILAALAAFAVAAGIDWMWELPAVTGLAFAAGGVAAAAGVGRSPGAALPRPAALAGAAIAVVAIVASAIPYLSETRLEQSRDAARAGDLVDAADDAAAARAVAPWAASPRLQLALVEERRGALAAARRAALEAHERAPEDWRTWVTLARIDTKLGRATQARRDLAEARRLNPRSPLFNPGER